MYNERDDRRYCCYPEDWYDDVRENDNTKDYENNYYCCCVKCTRNSYNNERCEKNACKHTNGGYGINGNNHYDGDNYTNENNGRRECCCNNSSNDNNHNLRRRRCCFCNFFRICK